MSKVKLTKEQAEAIERGIKIYGKSRIMNDHEPDGWVGNLVNLNEITKDEMARALYIGYEVEETFKVGDWVFDRESVYKIISKHHADDLNKGMYSKARHATPEEIEEEKQRRWWKKHDRGVWEIRKDDCLISKNDRHSCNVKFVEDCDDEGFLLVDGIKDEYILTVEELANKYQMFCFAKDRKDVQA